MSVADLAGGAWPQLARDAAVALVSSAAEDDTVRSPALQLLADIQTVFDTRFMKSDDLCSKLRALSESPWGQLELSPSALGARLREYSIKTRHTEDKTGRGYYLVDFTDAFARYLPDKASEDVPPVRSSPDRVPATGTNIGGFTNAVEQSPPVVLTSSGSVPDVADTSGRPLEGRSARPSPAAMPQHRHVGEVVSSKPPQRRRNRTRGRQLMAS